MNPSIRFFYYCPAVLCLGCLGNSSNPTATQGIEKASSAAPAPAKADQQAAQRQSKPRAEMTVTEALHGHWRTHKVQQRNRDNGGATPWEYPLTKENDFESGADEYFDTSSSPNRCVAIGDTGNETPQNFVVQAKNEKSGYMDIGFWSTTNRDGPPTSHATYYLSKDRKQLLQDKKGGFYWVYTWVDSKTQP